jgi:hypothetical protein
LVGVIGFEPKTPSPPAIMAATKLKFGYTDNRMGGEIIT